MKKTTKKSPKAESPDSPTPDEAGPETSKNSHGGKKILSLAIDPALHAKLALLARCEGRSVTDLVVEAVSRNLKARIATALEALKADLEK